MDDAVPAFGQLIGDARRAKGMSQEDLEAASGVSRGTLSRWETGRTDHPEPGHVRSVCRVLDVDPRRAAISLGYLTKEEVGTPASPTLDPQVQQVLDMLEDPALPADERRQWIDYLKWLYERARRQAS